jgi:hypothetical protein
MLLFFFAGSHVIKVGIQVRVFFALYDTLASSGNLNITS